MENKNQNESEKRPTEQGEGADQAVLCDVKGREKYIIVLYDRTNGNRKMVEHDNLAIDEDTMRFYFEDGNMCSDHNRALLMYSSDQNIDYSIYNKAENYNEKIIIEAILTPHERNNILCEIQDL